jgi:nucleoside phosphorylase
MPAPDTTPDAIDIAILIALPEEFRSLADDYADTWEGRPSPDHSGSDFFFTGPGGYRCVVAISPGMGPTIAGHISSCLLAYRPAALINVGIAGGFKDDLRIGDVIVPSMVEAYVETAKVDDTTERWKRRGAAYRPTSTLLAHVRELAFHHDSKARFQEWAEDGKRELEALDVESDRETIAELESSRVLRRTPLVETRYHLASGNFVVASREFAEFIRESNAEIRAGEMEAAGMMSTAEHRREPVQTLVLRGVSDHVDSDKKRADAIGDGALRRLAMDNAWRLLCLLMELNRLPRKNSARAESQLLPR